MQGLAMAVSPALQNPSTCSALFLDSIALAFHAHAVRACAGAPNNGVTRASLTPRQQKQALDDMEGAGERLASTFAGRHSIQPSYWCDRSPGRRANRFVERSRKLRKASQRQYQGGRHIRLQIHTVGDARSAKRVPNAFPNLNPRSEAASETAISRSIQG
jgi:hypothetical protein